MQLPIIKNLIVSSPDGNTIHAKLDLGGFGISRFFLDNKLKEIAIENGVSVFEETKVTEVNFDSEIFSVKYNGGEIFSKIVVGAFGKRSNLDVKWKRDFVKQKPGKLNNYIGSKISCKKQSAMQIPLLCTILKMDIAVFQKLKMMSIVYAI